jgi:hypothetical protein
VDTVTNTSIREAGADVGIICTISRAELLAGGKYGAFQLKCMIDVMDTSGAKTVVPEFSLFYPFYLSKTNEPVLTAFSYMLGNSIRRKLFHVEFLQKRAIDACADTCDNLLVESVRHSYTLYRKEGAGVEQAMLSCADSQVMEAVHITPQMGIRLAFLHRYNIYEDNAPAMETMKETNRKIILRELEYICVKLKGKPRDFIRHYKVAKMAGDSVIEPKGYFKDVMPLPAGYKEKDKYTANLIAYFDFRKRKDEETVSFVLKNKDQTFPFEKK